MRPDSKKVNRFRVREGAYATDDSYGNVGAFGVMTFNDGRHIHLQVIASVGGGWDHVSVSPVGPQRTPTWEEMCYVKDLFFTEDEVCVQYHPAKKDYVNHHPFTLHIWRPQTDDERQLLYANGCDDGPDFPTPGPLPVPPSIFVGPKRQTPVDTGSSQ
jgi:hypothetical protein